MRGFSDLKAIYYPKNSDSMVQMQELKPKSEINVSIAKNSVFSQKLDFCESLPWIIKPK